MIVEENRAQVVTCCQTASSQAVQVSGQADVRSDALASDAVWVDMLREQSRQLLDSRWGMRKSDDPRSREVRLADFRLVWLHIQRSYSRRSDTKLWVIGAFAVPAVILVPIIGADLGILFATFTALAWAVVHRVRRL